MHTRRGREEDSLLTPESSLRSSSGHAFGSTSSLFPPFARVRNLFTLPFLLPFSHHKDERKEREKRLTVTALLFGEEEESVLKAKDESGGRRDLFRNFGPENGLFR